MSFANILASRLATSSANCCKSRLPTYQQVRTAKTFQLRFRYGFKPLNTVEKLDEAKESGAIDQLAFKKVRFAQPDENCSPLWDDDLHNFTKYVMQGGKKSLADTLMHKTFYEIKSIQYRRLRKKLEKQSEEQAENRHENVEDGVASDKAVQKSIALALEEEEKIEDLEDKIEINPLTILKRALKNSEPIVVTKKLKRGGATYQVPVPLCASYSEFLAIKWIIAAVKDRPKPRTKPFQEVMAQELLDAAHLRGKVIKRRDDMHKLADANKAYAHYRWG